MTLVKFSKSNPSQALNPVFNDVFESFFNSNPYVSDRLISRVPAVNIAETDNEYSIELAVPGMKKDDFKIELDGNVLTISSEKENNYEENDGERMYKKEFSYQSFQRSFQLQKDVVDSDKIEAKYDNGLLHLVIPKKEEAKQRPPRKIQIA